MEEMSCSTCDKLEQSIDDLSNKYKWLEEQLDKKRTMCLKLLAEMDEVSKELSEEKGLRLKYERGLRDLKVYACSDKFTGSLENEMIHKKDVIRLVDETFHNY